MCNPTLIVAGASAVLQYQVANAQQKAIQDQQKDKMKLLCVIEKREWSLKVDSLSKKQKVD